MTAKFSFVERLHYRHRFWRYTHRTEPDTVHFIRNELRPGQTALDIGANKGIVTYFLARQAGPQGRVIAFEPQPEMAPQIRKMANTFKLENITIETLGLSDRCETMSLFRGEAGSTANMVEGRNWQQEKLEVETVTLDSYVEKEKLRVDFIKCDVDGYESQVLAGAAGVLREQKPKLLIEISEKNLVEISSIIDSYGYGTGEFFHGGRRYPAAETTRVPYRHEGAKFRNFLFVAV